MKRNKISIYVPGGVMNAVAYYRFMQYFDKMENIAPIYHKMLDDTSYKVLMPVGEKGLLTKMVAFFYITLRVTCSLICDNFSKPNTVIIARTLGKRYMPLVNRWLLSRLKCGGVKIIWDFDDDILEARELTNDSFEYLSKISDNIILASPYLKNLIQVCYHDKIIHLPTTDGTLCASVDETCIDERKESYKKTIRLLWVGTSSSIGFVKSILPHIEKAAAILKQKGKNLDFRFVCNRPLDYEPASFRLSNIIWSHENAAKEFLYAHIGLMPLHDNKATRGKGGFKMIQYLSVAMPAISSAVGINNDILKDGGGILVDDLNSDDWCSAICELSSNLNTWYTYSKRAKEVYDKRYSYDSNYKVWKELVGA